MSFTVLKRLGCYNSLLSFKLKQNLKAFYKRLLFKKSYQSLNNQNVVFVHVPKAAGMSVVNSLFGKEVGHNTYSFYEASIPASEIDDVYFFSFVRNPYSRLESAYNFLKQGGMQNYCADRLMSEYIKNKYPSFEIFVKGFTCDSYVLQHIHFIPQVSFIPDLEKFDFIGKVENFSSDYQRLLNILNVNAPTRNDNKSKRHNGESEYTDELKEIVFDFYQQDFEQFGYEK